MWHKSAQFIVPNQADKVAIVTGANKGLGFIVARELAQAGATVIIASRSADRGQAAVADIKKIVPKAQAKFMMLDLASLDSVREFTKQFKQSYKRLDILVNNGAVAMVLERQETSDGFEIQFGTNYLGHFALTGLLLDVLGSSPHARVVSIGSQTYERGKINFDDLQAKQNYGSWRAYAQSKLAIMLFMRELDRRLQGAGSHIISVAAHPGTAKTHSSAPNAPLLNRIIRMFSQLIGSSPEKGAQPYIYAATAATIKGGDYIGPGLFGKPPNLAKINKNTEDEAEASRLWAVSEELTEVAYDVKNISD